MLPPSLEDLSLLLTFIALILLLPTQILFPFHDLDLHLNKKRLKNIAQIFGVISIVILCVRAYLLLAA